MLFKYNREDCPKRIAGLSGHVALVGSTWQELPKALWEDAKEIPGIDIKESANEKVVVENDNISAKVYEALKDEEVRSKVITKAGKVSTIAMRDEVGITAPKHILDAQWSKVKEELVL